MSKKRKRARRPGRPEYQPTLEERQKVAIAAGGGMSHEEIAIGLGISRGTLEKHFEHELAGGAYARRLEVMNAMHAAALKGNVAAQKAYIAMDPQLAAPPPPKEQPKPAEKAKGKKQQADEDAVTAHHGDPEWKTLLSRAPATTTKQ